MWRGLASGLYVEHTATMATGEFCEVVSGPLQGMRARYERPGRTGRVIVQVELMGMGMAVDLPDCDIRSCE